MTKDQDPNLFMAARGKYKTRTLAEKNIPVGYDIVEDDEGFYGVKRETMDIICPLCGACHFETTEQFDPDKQAHPGMLRLKEPFAGWGWEPPPPDPSAGSGVLECRDCGGLLAPEGKLKLK